MALTTIDDRGLKTPIDLLDNEKIRFGTGNDLELFHDGASRITHTGAGNLVISTTATDSDLYLRGKDKVVIQPADGEDGVICNANGSVELYYDNSKKFETTSTGAKITKHLEIAADDGGLDLTAIASNSNAYIDIDSPANRRAAIRFSAAGTVKWTLGRGDSDELSENTFYIATGNSGGTDRKFTLTNTGDATFAGDVDLADDKKLKLGSSDDLQIYHNGTHSFLQHTYGSGNFFIESAANIAFKVAGNESALNLNSNGAVELYYDNSKKFETTTNGPAVSSGGADDSKLYFLTGNHTTTRIGYVGLGRFGMDVNGGVEIRDAGNSYETMFKTISNGAVEVYYDGSKKLNTTSTGAKISSSSNTTLHLTSSTSGSASIEFGDTDDDDEAEIWYDNYSKKLNFRTSESSDLVFYRNGSEKTRITSDGLTFNGDTAAANALSDYEEGTWTPDFFYHSSVSNVAGHYTKIGRMVYAYFTGNYYSNSSSHQYISNLPFTSSSTTGGNGGVARGYQNFNIQNGPVYYTEPNTTKLWFYQGDGNNFNASLGDGKSFRGVAIYHTDS